MLRRNDRNLDNIPIGALGLISLEGCEEMGDKVNDYLVKWRREDGHIHKNDVAFSGYERDTCLLYTSTAQQLSDPGRKKRTASNPHGFD